MTYSMGVSAFLAFGFGIELGLWSAATDNEHAWWAVVYAAVLALFWATA